MGPDNDALADFTVRTPMLQRQPPEGVAPLHRHQMPKLLPLHHRSSLKPAINQFTFRHKYKMPAGLDSITRINKDIVTIPNIHRRNNIITPCKCLFRNLCDFWQKIRERLL